MSLLRGGSLLDSGSGLLRRRLLRRNGLDGSGSGSTLLSGMLSSPSTCSLLGKDRFLGSNVLLATCRLLENKSRLLQDTSMDVPENDNASLPTLGPAFTRPAIPLGRVSWPFSAPRLMAFDKLLILAAELMSSLYLSARNLYPPVRHDTRKPRDRLTS